MDRRAYSTIQFKLLETDSGVIEGTASTPELDRQGDSMDPLGAHFRLPMPLLWQHHADQPIGQVIAASATSEGIRIRAQIAHGVTEEIDRAWKLIKAGLVRGLSIGWKPLADPITKHGQLTWPKWEWLELSAVTIPANASASISLIKSLDQQARAASGLPLVVRSPSGVPDSQKRTPMNVSEQLTTEKALLQQKSARLEELMSQEQAHGLEGDELTEKQTILGEVSKLTTSVGQLETLEAAQAKIATTVQHMPARPSVVSPSYPQVQVIARPKGQLFTRYAMAIGAGKGSYSDTLAYAKRWTDTPEVAAYIKNFWNNKAVEGTSVVASPGWGGELVNPNTAATEFLELLMPATIIGRVQGFNTVPFNIPIIEQTGGSTFQWVGESGAKPVGELAFTRTTLGYSKVAGIVVLTEELIRLSSPSAEAKVRQDLVNQCSKFLDEQFIQVGIAAGANNPASITNGVTSPAASGTDVGALLADLNTALATFDTVGSDGLVIVTTPALARGISLLTTTLGVRAFPDITPTGGTLLGYPVIVSASVDSGVIVIFKPSGIFMADDGRVTLDASNQATLDMDGGSPNSPTFSLWQQNCVGIRAERWIRWQKARDSVVAVIDTATYGPATGSP